MVWHRPGIIKVFRQSDEKYSMPLVRYEVAAEVVLPRKGEVMVIEGDHWPVTKIYHMPVFGEIHIVVDNGMREFTTLDGI